MQELKSMYAKFKRETPSMEIAKEGFLKVSKAMGVQVTIMFWLILTS
jgi:hypothetical protein